MYHDLIEIDWWDGSKRNIAEFVEKCPSCQHVKAENLIPGGLTQIMYVPSWKWKVINIDFVVGLPQTQRQNDSIWVSMERLTKSTHFILVTST